MHRMIHIGKSFLPLPPECCYFYPTTSNWHKQYFPVRNPEQQLTQTNVVKTNHQHPPQNDFFILCFLSCLHAFLKMKDLRFQLSDLRDCYFFPFFSILSYLRNCNFVFFVTILSISTAQLSSQKYVSHRPYFLMPLYDINWVILQPFQLVSLDASQSIEKTVLCQ